MKKTKFLKTVVLLILSVALTFGAVPGRTEAATFSGFLGRETSEDGYFTKRITIYNKFYNEDLCNYPSSIKGDIIPLFYIKYNGKSRAAYCIEPGAPTSGDWDYSGATGDTTTDPYWDYLRDNYSSLTESISLAAGYAEQYKGTSEWYAARTACQIIVWELMCGYRDPATRKVTNKEFFNATAGDKYIACYNSISEQMINHYTIPSFVSRYQNTAPTITLSYDENKKEWGKKITTTTGTVDMVDFAPLAAQGITATKIDDKTVYISAKNEISTATSYTTYKNLPQSLYASDLYVWTTYSGGERGQCLVTGTDNDPVPMYFKLNTETVYKSIEVNYYDKYTNEVIYTQYKDSGRVLNSEYDETARVLDTIEYDGRDYYYCYADGDAVTGIMDTDKEINLYYGYDHNVKVNYFDKYTNKIIHTQYVSESAEHNTQYDVTAQKLTELEFGGIKYTLDESLTSGDTFSGTLDTDKEINLYYGYGHKVMVNYFDKYTNEVIYTQYVSEPAEHNTQYDVTAQKLTEIEFGGIKYTLDESLTSGDTFSGTLDTDKAINLYYGYGHKVMVNYFDKYTNEVIYTQYVSEPAEHLSVYDVSDHKLVEIEFSNIKYTLDENLTAGDSFSGTLDADKEINLYYGYVHNVTIEYRDEDTGEIISETVTYAPENEHNSEYDKTSDTELEIEGYTKTKVTGDTDKGTLDTDKLIVVWYKKNPEPVPETDDVLTSLTLCGLIVGAACASVLMKKKEEGAV